MTLARAAIVRAHRRVEDRRKVNPRVRHEVRLELGQVDIQRAVEALAGGDRADHLGDQAVQMLVTRALDTEAVLADIVHSLIVDEEGSVRVFDGDVGGQHCVVGLYHGGDPGRRQDGEPQLGLSSILGGESCFIAEILPVESSSDLCKGMARDPFPLPTIPSEFAWVEFDWVCELPPSSRAIT